MLKCMLYAVCVCEAETFATTTTTCTNKTHNKTLFYLLCILFSLYLMRSHQCTVFSVSVYKIYHRYKRFAYHHRERWMGRQPEWERERQSQKLWIKTNNSNNRIESQASIELVWFKWGVIFTCMKVKMVVRYRLVLKPHLNPNVLCYNHTTLSSIFSVENTWVNLFFFLSLSIVDVLLAIEMAKKEAKSILNYLSESKEIFYIFRHILDLVCWERRRRKQKAPQQKNKINKTNLLFFIRRHIFHHWMMNNIFLRSWKKVVVWEENKRRDRVNKTHKCAPVYMIHRIRNKDICIDVQNRWISNDKGKRYL